MLGILITIVIVVLIAYMVLCESKYLFSKPSGCRRCGRAGCRGCWQGKCKGCGRGECRGCGRNTWPNALDSAKTAFNTAVSKVKEEARALQNMMQADSAKTAFNTAVSKVEEEARALQRMMTTTPITPVIGAHASENTINEYLPFSEFKGLSVADYTPSDIIEGPSPPKDADPRVMNPSLAAAPVQFSDPSVFGAFGVTDNSNPAFGKEHAKTDAMIASDRTLEGFEGYDANGAMLVMDGKIVKKPCQLPSYQLKDFKHHTVLPMRSIHSPPPRVEDLVEADMFDGLQGYPINEKGDLLTPPGCATPGSEWASIMYGYKNNDE
jgi:hypothetical protein